MTMKPYHSLFSQSREQAIETVFAHFYPVDNDWDEPFKIIAKQTMDGLAAWGFTQEPFKNRHPYTAVPKLKNYLNYTFKRLVDLEQEEPGTYFVSSPDTDWITFNTGLQNVHGADLLAVFQRYIQRFGASQRADW